MLLSHSTYLCLFIFFLGLPAIALFLLLRKQQIGSMSPGTLLGITMVVAIAFVFLTGIKSRNVYVVKKDLSVSRYISYFGGTYTSPTGERFAVDLEFKRSCLVINLSAHDLKLEGRGIATWGRRGRTVDAYESEVLGCETIDYFPLDRPTARQIRPRGLNSVFWLKMEERSSPLDISY